MQVKVWRLIFGITRATFWRVAGPDLGVHFGPPIWEPIVNYCLFCYLSIQTGGFILVPNFWLGNLLIPCSFGEKSWRSKLIP